MKRADKLQATLDEEGEADHKFLTEIAESEVNAEASGLGTKSKLICRQQLAVRQPCRPVRGWMWRSEPLLRRSPAAGKSPQNFYAHCVLRRKVFVE